MSKEKAVQAAGRGFPTLGILTVLFFVFKVFGLINWSWWLVFAPLWAPLALAVVVVFFVLVIAVVIAALE